MEHIKVGDFIIYGYEKTGIGVVAGFGKGAPGVWVLSRGELSFMPEWMVEDRIAKVGVNVCDQPLSNCYCGMHHPRREILAEMAGTLLW